MDSPPTGTVTFLFTDIEGSSRLWEQDPDAMAGALALHDAILRSSVRDYDGYIVKMRGDGIHAAFSNANDALRSAVAAQLALHSTTWPQSLHLKVRCALHTAMADVRDGDYFGPEVNRAARLVTAGHGGQILLSAATQAEVRGDLPDGVTLLDLGLHRLKDLLRANRIFQVIAPGLPSHFLPIITISTRPHVLPSQLTPFIGRTKEIADCLALLRRSDVHLLTLTGAGGSGKTRLGLQLAADLLEDFADGVFFVDLSVVRDPAVVPAAIARVLGIPEAPGVDIMSTLSAYAGRRQLLLVLDNFEHVLPAALAVSQLLTVADQVKVLATSRAPLRLVMEYEYPVPPLTLPDP